jgi:EAL domain-containing protein (putative c-di-GMP-specific phosphodiesterase class I)
LAFRAAIDGLPILRGLSQLPRTGETGGCREPPSPPVSLAADRSSFFPMPPSVRSQTVPAVRHGFASLPSRFGFLATFSLLSLLAVAALAVALSTLIRRDARREELREAQNTGELLAAASFAPKLLPRLADAPRRFRALDRVVLAAQRSHDLDAAIVWTPRGRVVYANNHRLIGRRYGISSSVAAALRGRTATRIQDRASGPADLTVGKQIVVTVPLLRPRGSRVAAVFELHIPYGPVASDISQRTRTINLILFGSALLFYALLWPRLLAASRALRRESNPTRQRLIKELRRALERDDELTLHYQPKIEIRGGLVVGAEALVRWQHPRRGLIGASEFISDAAAGGLTGPLTVFVVDRALRDCRRWRESGVDAGVNVNLSATNVLDVRLPGEIVRLLEKWRLPPCALGVEITEAAIAADPQQAGEVLHALSELGLRIAIDDFGTGYSSLAGLRDLPIDELKIDRSFVAGLRDPHDATIVRSVIGLAHELGVTVIAEGVEDEATFRELAALGCDQAQGYFIARPMALDTLTAWLAAPVMVEETRAATDPAPSPA